MLPRGIIDSAISEAKKSFEVLYAGEVMKIHDDKGSDKRILIITDACIMYFEEKKTPKESRRFYWCNLTSYNTEENRFNFKFKKNFGQSSPEKKYLCRFVTQEFGHVKNIIDSILNRSLLKEEISKFNGTYFSFPINSAGLISRFRSYSYSLCGPKATFVNECLKDLFSSIKNCRPFLPIKSSMIRLIPSILQTILASPYVDTLFFPNTEKLDIYALLSAYLPRLNRISRLKVSTPPTKKFNDFLTHLGSIKTLSFSNIKLDKSAVTQINQSIANSNVYDLSFNSITGPKPEDFLPPNSPITSFHFTHCNVNLESLIPHCLNLSSLDLSFSQLEIFDIFSMVCRVQQIQTLDVSGNKCTKWDASIKMSTSRIGINSVAFSSSAFSKALFAIFEVENLCLSSRSLSFPNDADFSIFSKMQNVTIKELDWSSNIVNDHFFEFISKQSQMRVLFIDEVKISEDLLFEKAPRTLTHFFARHVDRLCFMSLIVSMSERCRDLICFDISNNKLEDNVIDKLALFQKMANLDTLIFDGTNDSLAHLVDIFENRNFFLICPNLDMTCDLRMRINKMTSLPELQENGDQSIPINRIFESYSPNYRYTLIPQFDTFHPPKKVTLFDPEEVSIPVGPTVRRRPLHHKRLPSKVAKVLSSSSSDDHLPVRKSIPLDLESSDDEVPVQRKMVTSSSSDDQIPPPKKTAPSKITSSDSYDERKMCDLQSGKRQMILLSDGEGSDYGSFEKVASDSEPIAKRFSSDDDDSLKLHPSSTKDPSNLPNNDNNFHKDSSDDLQKNHFNDSSYSDDLPKPAIINDSSTDSLPKLNFPNDSSYSDDLPKPSINNNFKESPDDLRKSHYNESSTDSLPKLNFPNDSSYSDDLPKPAIINDSSTDSLQKPKFNSNFKESPDDLPQFANEKEDEVHQSEDSSNDEIRKFQTQKTSDEERPKSCLAFSSDGNEEEEFFDVVSVKKKVILTGVVDEESSDNNPFIYTATDSFVTIDDQRFKSDDMDNVFDSTRALKGESSEPYVSTRASIDRYFSESENKELFLLNKHDEEKKKPTSESDDSQRKIDSSDDDFIKKTTSGDHRSETSSQKKSSDKKKIDSSDSDVIRRPLKKSIITSSESGKEGSSDFQNPINKRIITSSNDSQKKDSGDFQKPIKKSFVTSSESGKNVDFLDNEEGIIRKLIDSQKKDSKKKQSSESEKCQNDFPEKQKVRQKKETSKPLLQTVSSGESEEKMPLKKSEEMKQRKKKPMQKIMESSTDSDNEDTMRKLAKGRISFSSDEFQEVAQYSSRKIDPPPKRTVSPIFHKKMAPSEEKQLRKRKTIEYQDPNWDVFPVPILHKGANQALVSRLQTEFQVNALIEVLKSEHGFK